MRARATQPFLEDRPLVRTCLVWPPMQALELWTLRQESSKVQVQVVLDSLVSIIFDLNLCPLALSTTMLTMNNPPLSYCFIIACYLAEATVGSNSCTEQQACWQHTSKTISDSSCNNVYACSEFNAPDATIDWIHNYGKL